MRKALGETLEGVQEGNAEQNSNLKGTCVIHSIRQQGLVVAGVFNRYAHSAGPYL